MHSTSDCSLELTFVLDNLIYGKSDFKLFILRINMNAETNLFELQYKYTVNVVHAT